MVHGLLIKNASTNKHKCTAGLHHIRYNLRTMKSIPLSAIKRYLASNVLATPAELNEIEKLIEEAMSATLAECSSEDIKLILDEFMHKRHYFACKRLVLALQSSRGQASSIDIFGRGHIAKWNLVVKKQESNNLFLSQSMKLLVNDVYVNIPELKKMRHDANWLISELKVRIAHIKEMLVLTSRELSDLKSINLRTESTLSECVNIALDEDVCNLLSPLSSRFPILYDFSRSATLGQVDVCRILKTSVELLEALYELISYVKFNKIEKSSKIITSMGRLISLIKTVKSSDYLHKSRPHREEILSSRIHSLEEKIKENYNKLVDFQCTLEQIDVNLKQTVDNATELKSDIERHLSQIHNESTFIALESSIDVL